MARTPISVRLSDEEYAEIARRSDGDGYLVSSFIRNASLAAAARGYLERDLRRDKLAVAVVRATGELVRIRERWDEANVPAVAVELSLLREVLMAAVEGVPT